MGRKFGRGRRATAVVLAAILGWVISGQAAVARDDSRGDSEGVLTRTVCFSVRNGIDVNTSSVIGTLFHRGRYTSSSKVILLLHGSGSDRSVFDGGAAGDESPSMARLLARAGYVVITYDRLGFGQSTYAGDARTLTQFNQVDMAHQVITQIREGTFTQTAPLRDDDDKPSTATCPIGRQASFGLPTVILSGHSSGGIQVENYATHFHDVAAVIPLDAGNFGSPLQIDIVQRVIIPQIQRGEQYISIFGLGPSGISTDCLAAVFFQPGADEEVFNTNCANQNLGRQPVGDGVGVRGETLARIKQHLISIPLLLVFADHDALVIDSHREAEITFFQQNCSCDFNVLIQREAGHAGFWHRSAPQMVDGIVDWLVSKGLAPAEPRDD